MFVGNMNIVQASLIAGRDKRSVVIGDSWPPPSRDNWVEVMVVVDGTMVKYHGKSVQHYVLTLMQIVSLTLLVLLM